MSNCIVGAGGRVVTPPDHIVRLMKERAGRLSGVDAVMFEQRITRALIEAWVEGVNAGFEVDDFMKKEIGR